MSADLIDKLRISERQPFEMWILTWADFSHLKRKSPSDALSEYADTYIEGAWIGWLGKAEADGKGNAPQGDAVTQWTGEDL